MLSDRDIFFSMLVTMPIYSTYEKLSFVTDVTVIFYNY